MTVKDLLDEKGRETIFLDASDTVDKAIATMTERNVSAVLVRKNSRTAGIFTERDVLRAYRRWPEQFSTVLLEQAMSADLIVAEPEEDLCAVMSVMIEKRIRHMPVMEQGKVAGMLSIRDVVKTQVGNLKSEIHHLKDYLSGI
ncbi:MAG: CBS domain-containing protein [Nitrospirota bacterium]|nr:CBS domain-containing protein [Nitrospirota bacterium]